ncbi:hypothetical protein OHA21_19490 [Actinoplanes sp. NBC_00393]|uniref:hypothetical protein n=1 Tax=Actinoplanes sp. NBC_00393 TaxID=2975953 RepID=UPI002E24AB17
MKARLCLVSAALLVTSCGGQDHSAAGPLLPADVRAMASTADAGAVLELAQSVLIAQCMNRRGFSYPLDANAARADLSTPTAGTSAVSWPEDDEAKAARAGLAPAEPASRPSTALETYVRGLSAGRQQAFSLALNGDPRGGSLITVTLPDGQQVQQSRESCNAEALQDLYGDLEGYLRGRITADNVNTIARARVTADPAFISAERRWRACISGHGWTVGDQAELSARVADAGAELVAGERRRLERRAAVLAARCNRQGGLSAAGRRLTETAVRAVRAELGSLLDDLSRREQAALPHARQLVADAAP